MQYDLCDGDCVWSVCELLVYDYFLLDSVDTLKARFDTENMKKALESTSRDKP